MTLATGTRLEFREDVQGLRGLAVLLVVLFHTGLVLPGGFIGVDVFFVISGYLIVGLIQREVSATGRLDLAAFFSRRVRRLLPALSLATSVTVVVSALVVEVGDPLRSIVRTAVGASLFSANAVLYLDQDYFAPSAERNPLLHTWSLSVEEQFYLVVPVVLALTAMLVSRARRGNSGSGDWTVRARAVLVGITALSFTSSVWLVDLGGSIVGIESTEAFAFYAPVTRAWEFGVGGLLALAPGPDPARARFARPMVLAGGGAVLASALLLGPSAPFPGVRAVPVVLGTAAIVRWGNLQSMGRRGAVLEHSALVRLGDLSYSWYLWHWPAIVLSHAVWGSLPAVTWAAVGVSLLLAQLSFSLVEQPLRRMVRISGWRAALLLAALVAFPSLLAGGVGQLNGSVAATLADGDRTSWSRSRCHFEQEQGGPWPGQPCVRGMRLEEDGSVDVLLLGDSHADAMADGLLAAAESEGLSLAVWTASSQPSIGESEWMERFVGLARELRPDVIVLANRTLGHLDADEYDHWAPSEWVSREVAREEWARQLTAAAQRYLESSRAVVWIHNVPEVSSASLGREVGPTLLRPDAIAVTFTRSELARQRAGIIELEMESLGGLEGVTLVDPAESLCSPVCSNVRDGVLLYADGQHLSTAGSRAVAPQLAEALRRALE